MPHNRTKEDTTMKPQLMPFQTKYPITTRNDGFKPTGRFFSAADIARVALPIFGGTSPAPNTESSSTESSSKSGPGDDSKTSSSSGGADGDSSKPTEQLTPEQISDLVKQVSTLSETSANLEKELQGYKDKEDQARKATLSKEQAQQEELDKAYQTIAAMDEVVKYVALVNAIQSNKELQFHDVNFVISKLDHESYQFDVDLESKKATVSGIENELKRIAKENDWAVKVASNPQSSSRQPGVVGRRSSGAPPANPTVDGTKAERRRSLETKWPVITHGRAMTTGR